VPMLTRRRFPYIDTLKILEKFGAGALFYGQGSDADLDDIERRCQGGEKFLALYCEFPGNPLLKTPDLERIRRISSTWGFPMVVDETIGNILNVDILPVVDIAVNSLTKLFSGDANVMGGRLVLSNSTASKVLTEQPDAESGGALVPRAEANPPPRIRGQHVA